MIPFKSVINFAWDSCRNLPKIFLFSVFLNIYKLLYGVLCKYCFAIVNDIVPILIWPRCVAHVGRNMYILDWIAHNLLTWSLDYKKIAKLKSMLVYKDFQTCHLIVWQQSHQPIRTQCQQIFVNYHGFWHIFYSIIQTPDPHLDIYIIQGDVYDMSLASPKVLGQQR